MNEYNPDPKEALEGAHEALREAYAEITALKADQTRLRRALEMALRDLRTTTLTLTEAQAAGTKLVLRLQELQGREGK